MANGVLRRTCSLKSGRWARYRDFSRMTSTSSDGCSVITLEFNLTLNIDVAEQEVQQSINASGTYFAG